MSTHHHAMKRETVAVAALATLVVVLALGVAIGADDGATRAAAGLVAVTVAAGAALLVSRLRSSRVVVDGDRIGYSTGLGPTRWCELAAVLHVTANVRHVVDGGPQRDLVLWTTRGGTTGVAAMLARSGVPKAERPTIAELRREHPDLRPFPVPLIGLDRAAVDEVLAAVRDRQR